MFEITKPTSTTSNFSTSLAAGKPPKGDSGVIRDQPISGRYKLLANISNKGNEHAVYNVRVIVNSITISNDHQLEILTNEYTIGYIDSEETKEASFELQALNEDHLPEEGDSYQIEGIIQFHQEGVAGEQENPLSLKADYQGD